MHVINKIMEIGSTLEEFYNSTNSLDTSKQDFNILFNSFLALIFNDKSKCYLEMINRFDNDIFLWEN